MNKKNTKIDFDEFYSNFQEESEKYKEKVELFGKKARKWIIIILLISFFLLYISIMLFLLVLGII